MKTYLLFALALTGSSCSVFAQLPEAPEPRPITQTATTTVTAPEIERHNPFIRVYQSHRVSLIAAMVGRSADAADTCINLEKFHGQEVILPAPIKSCAGVAILSEATVPLGWLTGKLFHRFGWRKIETLPNWVNAGLGFAGFGYSFDNTLNHPHFGKGTGSVVLPVIHPPSL